VDRKQQSRRHRTGSKHGFVPPRFGWNRARRTTVLTVFAFALVSLSPAQALGRGPEFAPATEVATINGVPGLDEYETADMNGDGNTDVVVTRSYYPPAYETSPIGILLSDGHGGFRDGSDMYAGPAPTTEGPGQLVLADYNGDGRTDIFYADSGYDASPFPGYQNRLVLSTPDGKLVDASANLPPASDFSHSATAADIDRDGDIDIYVGNIFGGDSPPYLLVNDGTGHFTRDDTRLPSQQTDRNQAVYTRSLFGDVNNDGTPDLVLGAAENTSRSAVLLNDGTGHFSLVPNALPPKAFDSTAITIALATLDVNADGKADLIAAYTQQTPFYVGRKLQVLIGAGDGTFADETAARLPAQDEGDAWIKSIRIADLNNDGRLDFAGESPYGAPAQPALYIDNGGVYVIDRTGSPVQFFVFLDANKDGREDIFSSVGGVSPCCPEHHYVQRQLRDDDGDGIPNDVDRCPVLARPAFNGCPGARLTSSGRLRLVHSRGRVNVASGIHASCPATGYSCAERASVKLRGRTLARLTRSLKPGQILSVDFKLTRTASLVLRRRRRSTLTVSVSVTGADGQTAKLVRHGSVRR